MAREKTRNERGVSRGMKFLFRIVGGLPLQSQGKVVEKGRSEWDKNARRVYGIDGCFARAREIIEDRP